jgi:chorismate mutase
VTTPSPNADPLIRQLREQISDTDRALVDAMNKRLQLVARLKQYKESRGIDFVDPEREEWMLSYLQRANRGPLTTEGLRELFAEILDLTKREVARGEEEG